MVRLIKPKKIPDVLKTDGAKETKDKCRAYSLKPSRYIAIGKKPAIAFQFDREIYASAVNVKPILLTAQNYKCCYCEKSQWAGNLHVEHYRPKTRVKQAPKEKWLYPGYYWLAYTWSNLFLSCRDCNCSYKGDLFPLEMLANRARNHTDRLSKEGPLLVNPQEDPTQHIKFDLYGQPTPLTRKGSKTIESLGLLRDQLVRDRLKKLIEILNYRATVELSAKYPGNKDLKELAKVARGALEDAKSPLAEFSGMVNDVVNEPFDTVKHLMALRKRMKSL